MKTIVLEVPDISCEHCQRTTQLEFVACQVLRASDGIA